MSLDDFNNRKLLDQLTGAAQRRQLDELSGVSLRRDMDRLTGADLHRTMARVTGEDIFGVAKMHDAANLALEQARGVRLAEFAHLEVARSYEIGQSFAKQIKIDAELMGQLGRGFHDELLRARKGWEDLASGIIGELGPTKIAKQMEAILGTYRTQQEFLGAQISAHSFALKSLELVDWKQLTAATTYALKDFDRLRGSMNAIGRSYGALIRDLAAADPITLPPVVFDLPPLDVASHVDFLFALGKHEEDEPPAEADAGADTQLLLAELRRRVDGQLSPRLHRVHEGLPKMWAGAQEALHSDNPDRIRQFAASTRELVTHILHLLAPDDRIKEWSSDPEHYDRKRPTRKARILYICRGVASGSYVKFVENILRGTLAKLDFLHGRTHEIDPSLEDRLAEALWLSIGGDLLLLIESDTEN